MRGLPWGGRGLCPCCGGRFWRRVFSAGRPASAQWFGGLGGYAEGPLPPTAIMRSLMQRGFIEIGRPRFDGAVYVVEGVNARGMRLRLVIDAFDGGVISRTRLDTPLLPPADVGRDRSARAAPLRGELEPDFDDDLAPRGRAPGQDFGRERIDRGEPAAAARRPPRRTYRAAVRRAAGRRDAAAGAAERGCKAGRAAPVRRRRAAAPARGEKARSGGPAAGDGGPGQGQGRRPSRRRSRRPRPSRPQSPRLRRRPPPRRRP